MPKTLLLADDSVTIQKVVAISFASEDVKVIAVDNGDDAIARTRDSRPDVVLADVVMPGKNGYEVCEAIKADPALAHIPVLLLTGTFEAFDEARAEQAGATGHIAKPFEAKALVDEVKRLLRLVAETPVATPLEPIAESFAEPEVVGEALEEATPAHDNAFDFFDDEPATASDSASDGAVDEDALDLEFQSSDTSFSLGREDLAKYDAGRHDGFEVRAVDAPQSGERSVPVAADFGAALEPVEVMGGNALAETTVLDANFEELSIEPNISADADSAGESLVASASTSAEEPFDFAVEVAPSDAPDLSTSLDGTDPVLPIDAEDLAQETIIDPKGASGYDVSSSDLDDFSSSELGSVPKLEPLPDDPAEADDAIARYAELMPGLVEPDATIMAPLFRSVGTRDSDLEEPVEIDPDPVAIVVEDASPVQFAEEVEAEPAAVEESRPAMTPVSAETMLQNIEPELRQQLHDTLEKIAWESFGELTEAIVRQSVERVEAIAWEVLPQMAETLIREEIRRLKGDPSDNA
jgi:CheY-like chemotaxis protein